MGDRAIQELSVPKWGLTMTEAKVVRWLVAVGDEVAPGDDVVEIETEKITGAIESPVAGVIRRQVAQEDESVPVGGLLGVVAGPEVADDQIDRFIDSFEVSSQPSQVDLESAEPGCEKVDVGGRVLRYLRRGEGGQPILLLHGFGGDLNNWLLNHERLAARHTVYALDLPGHGESTKQVGEGSVDSLAEVVGGFMDAVGLAEAHLVGHSLGGAVVLQLALTQPRRVTSCVLICPAGLGPEINVPFINGFVSAVRRKEIKPHLEKLFADPSLVNRRLVDDVLKFKRLDGVETALRTIAGKFITDGQQRVTYQDRLGDISAPVLVIWGAKDQIIPVSHTQRIPESFQCEILENQGHMVQMEAASQVTSLIDRFVR